MCNLYTSRDSRNQNLTTAAILPRLERVTQTGPTSWIASCPVDGHEDKNPSFSLTESGGKLLAKCHAGCAQGAVFQALRGLAGHDETRASEPTRSAHRPPAMAAQKITDDDRQFLINEGCSPDDDLYHMPSPEDDREALERIERDKKINRAIRTWNKSTGPLEPVEGYLSSRGVTMPDGEVLRFNKRLWHRESNDYWPGMVALIQRPTGPEILGVHRTFLAHDFKGKAPVKPPKKFSGVIGGGVIKLQKLTGNTLILAEGIETALSASSRFGYPAWAALSAGNLEMIERLPDHATRAIIAADNGHPGRIGAARCAENLARSGVECRIFAPPEIYSDWNDFMTGNPIEGEAA